MRAATSRDITAVLSLWKDARSAAAVTPDDEEVVGRLLRHAPDALLLAEFDGRVVGTLIAAWDGWRGNMYRLAVLPEFRRQGVARRLVREGHRRLWEKGARRVTALVAEAEAEAVGVWIDAGYERDAKIGRYVRNLSDPSRAPRSA